MTHLRRHRLVLLVLALCALSAAAPAVRADEPPTGRQYALLVGVRNYKKDELRRLDYTENDVTELAQLLRDAGYKRVVLMTQSEAVAQGDNDLEPTGKNIRRQFYALLEDRKPEDGVLIAFSGHGVQTKKGCYFCPSDAELTDTRTLVSLPGVYYVLAKCPAAMKVLLADACRNDPFAGGAKDATKLDLESVTRPQAEKPPGGVAALFSCSEGERSYESAKFKHGVFFHYVLEGLRGAAANKNGEVTLERLAAHVKDGAPDEAKDEWGPEAKQHPQLVGSLSGTAPLVAASAKRKKNSLGMELVRIEPGTFLMGSPADDASHYDEELPQHEVTLTRPYFMGAYPATKGQFAAFVKDAGYRTEAEAGEGGWGYNAATRKVEGWLPIYSWRKPGFAQGDDHPVVDVTWKDAVEFCKWLSKKEGEEYALPTEAEWEYACRAGTATRFWCGDTDASLEGNANIGDASLKTKMAPEQLNPAAAQPPWDDGYPFTSPVGKFKPNPWGLYDMHGNVWQWCADRAGRYEKSPATDPKGPEKGNLRILRGGAWGEDPRHCRSADRFFNDPVNRHVYMGFRVVLRPAATTP